MTLYYIIMAIHIISIFVMFAEMVYVTIQRPSPMQSHIILTIMSTLLMFVGYYFELTANSLDTAFMGTIISYTGKPFILNCGFLVICDFYGVKIRKWVYYLLNCMSAFVTLSVYTTKITHLYYTSWSFDPTNKYEPLMLKNGPLYYVYLVSIFVLFGLSIYVIAREYFKNKNEENLIFAKYFGAMLISGISGYVVYLTNVFGGYDTSIFGLIGSTICLSVLFFKYNIFDVLTLAKDQALENSPTGVVIIDNRERIIYSNILGKELLSRRLTADYLGSITENISKYYDDGKVYEVVKRSVKVRGRSADISYEFTDVTSSVDYQVRLEHDVTERTQQIENIQREIIGSLASVVEARSLETGKHIVRTREYVQIICEQLQKKEEYRGILTDDYVNLLMNAAPLHDIGKVSVSDVILNKPAKLTKKEYEEMKKHVIYGAEVIEKTMRGVEDDIYVDIAKEVALYHHEWWNGEGYSKRLKGTQIPLSARIMAVADCFDALISKRCYKPPFTKANALKTLKLESGTHFDPEIVDAFVKGLKVK